MSEIVIRRHSFNGCKTASFQHKNRMVIMKQLYDQTSRKPYIFLENSKSPAFKIDRLYNIKNPQANFKDKEFKKQLAERLESWYKNEFEVDAHFTWA